MSKFFSFFFVLFFAFVFVSCGDVSVDLGGGDTPTPTTPPTPVDEQGLTEAQIQELKLLIISSMIANMEQERAIFTSCDTEVPYIEQDPADPFDPEEFNLINCSVEAFECGDMKLDMSGTVEGLGAGFLESLGNMAIRSSHTFPAGIQCDIDLSINLNDYSMVGIICDEEVDFALADIDYLVWESDSCHYKVGGIGPALGWIFLTPDCEGNDTPFYFEAAPEDLDVLHQYSNVTDSEIGIEAQGQAIGTGYTNSEAIISQGGHLNSAANECRELVEVAYSDFFLPSKDELNAMYENLHLEGLGDFASDYYWSSSEDNDVNAWFQGFSDGYPPSNAKTISNDVRCIRAF